MRHWLKHDLNRPLSMSKLNRLLHLLAASLSLGAAFAVFTGVGLPERGDFSGLRAEDGQIKAPEVGALAPPFSLPTADSGMFSLAEVRGTITIINFWATWCPPCQREMRDLQQLYISHRGKARILAVNLGESVQAARKWARQLGLTYDVLLDRHGVVAKLYQVRGLPTTAVLDGESRIRRLYYGPVTIEQLRRDVSRIGRGT